VKVLHLVVGGDTIVISTDGKTYIQKWEAPAENMIRVVAFDWLRKDLRYE